MLRLATIEDAEAIATIHVRTWQTVYEGIIPAQHLASLSIQKRANLWRRTISERHGTVLLALERDRHFIFMRDQRYEKHP